MTKHILSLKTYMQGLSEDDRDTFAKKCKTTQGQLKQIYYGNRPCNESLAIEIEKHSYGNVKCDDLCPDADFQYLRNSLKKQKQTA